MMVEMLKMPCTAEEVYKKALELGISERTVKIAKKNLGITAKKIGDKWFWQLPSRE